MTSVSGYGRGPPWRIRAPAIPGGTALGSEPQLKTLRTPDERFAGLLRTSTSPPKYVEIADSEDDTLRVHYLREGDPDAPVILLMHGEPSWSFLYRKI